MNPLHVLLPAQRACNLCPLHVGIRSVGIPTIRILNSLPVSLTTPALVFIGMNPGHNEDLQGVPFVGRSGLLLRGGKDHKGRTVPGPYIDGNSFRTRCTIYATNAVRCYSPNADPLPTHSNACFPYTTSDLTTITSNHQRTAIVCLGGFATRALYKSLNIAKASIAYAIEHSAHPYPTANPLHVACVFATFHPSFYDRKPAVGYAIHDHLQLVSDWISGYDPTPSPPTCIPPCFPPPP